MKEIIIREKSFAYAVRIVKLYQYLISKKKEFVLAKQILRCGTSIGANVEEASGGVSKADFKNKLSIAYKEGRETQFWLRLLLATDYIDRKMYESLNKDCDELMRILYTIIHKSNF